METPSVEVLEGLRLSPQQRSIWSLHSRGALPVTRVLVRILGELDSARLERALGEVVTRHEILRTRFRESPTLKYPLQRVVEGALPEFSVLPIAAPLGAAHGEETLSRLWEDALSFEAQERGAVCRATCVQVAQRQFTLLLMLSSLCSDAESVQRFLGELARAYSGLGGGEPPLQYGQFADWQNELEAESPAVRAPFVPTARLPWEAHTTGDAAPQFQRLEARLEAHIASSLEARAATYGVALESLLLASFQLQIARLTAQTEVALAVVRAGRELPELEEVLGPLATVCALRCKVDEALPLMELARRAQWVCGEAGDASLLHQSALSDSDRAASIGFAYHAFASLDAGGLRWQVEQYCAGPSGCKLMLTVSRHARELVLTCWFDARRFVSAGVEQMLEQYGALLAGVSRYAAEQPRAAALSMLSAGERTRQLARSERRKQLPELTPLHCSFELHARRSPDALALICRDEQLSYAALNRAANRLAHRLRAQGVTRDACVGLWCERNAQTIMGMLGILKAGAAYVPLDPQAPRERLADQVRLARLSLIVASGDPGSWPSGLRIVDLNDSSLVRETETDREGPVPLDTLASIVFTSGSTGVPKGVAVTQRGMASYTAALCGALEFAAGLHFATVSTLTADLGNTSIFAAFATGGCLHVIDYATATDGPAFARYCRARPLDVLKIVPSHLSALMDASEGGAVLPKRVLVLGGEALAPSLVERIAAASPTCAVVNHYGPTETTVGALVLPLNARRDSRGEASIPIGRPLANTEAYVLDACFSPVPTGVVGELYLGGAGLARGYLGRPDLTAERFIPHPFAQGARLYRTGDLARYRPDGTIEFLGRRDHQLKIRGFRVELGEIEARIREHPGVSQAAAVAAQTDGACPTLFAHVVPRDGSLDEASLRAFLKERLPDYMMPGELALTSALPLNANGKIDRQRLLTQVRARARKAYVAPRTPTEQIIADIWAAVLRVPQVGVHDDFFELGGHSLLAIPLVHRVQLALRCTLSLASVLEARTVAGLAATIDAPTAKSSLVPLRAHGSRAPLFCIDPTGQHVTVYRELAAALGEEQPVWGLDLGPALAALGSSVSVEAVVELLTADLQAAGLRGPFRLLGWSLGGVLALGLTRALEARGERVALLGILDSQARTQLYANGEPDPLEELSSYLDRGRLLQLRARAPGEVQALRSALQGRAAAERVDEAVRWAQRHELLPADVVPEAFRIRYTLLRSAAMFVEQLERPCIAAPVHVWWSREMLERHGGAAEAWQEFSRARVTTALVEGDHEGVVRSPAVHERLRALLAVPSR